LKNLSLVAGIKELDRINQYALEGLSQEERQFIEKINKTVKGYENGSGVLFGFNEQVKIQMLWQKYAHLKPFQFRFNPKEKIPKVFKNRTAFIIWTTWKAKHLVCQNDDIDSGSLAAAKLLQKYKPSFMASIKKATVQEFLKYLHPSYSEPSVLEAESDELIFWETEIFPFLEGKWEFKWELVQKCFYCSKDAIAICDSISPTSSTGKTPERPFCEDCIASIPGINIVKWLVPRHEGEKEVEYALRKRSDKENNKKAEKFDRLLHRARYGY